MVSIRPSRHPAVASENESVRAALKLMDDMDVMLQTGNAAALGGALSREFIASDPSNTIRSRDDLVALVSSGRLKYSAINRETDVARQLGHDLVVVMGTETTTQSAVPAEGRVKEAALTSALRRRFTNIFRKEDGTWKLLVKQSTIIAVE